MLRLGSVSVLWLALDAVAALVTFYQAFFPVCDPGDPANNMLPFLDKTHPPYCIFNIGQN